MKIVNCDEKIISNLNNIMKLIDDEFGESDVYVYAVLDDNNLGFIVRGLEKCMFINHKGEHTLFSVNDKDELFAVRKKDYSVIFDSCVCFVGNNKQMSLSIRELSQPDEDDYTGAIRFLQYDEKTDTMCEITYQQMYREHDGFAPIYSFHTKRIDRVYINEQYSKKKDRPGLLTRKHRYFNKSTFKEGEICYNICAIKDYGLVNFLRQGAYNLIKDSEAVVYSRFVARDFDKALRDIWPITRSYTEEEIKEIIRQYGFKTEIPSELLTVYNRGDETVETIKELVRLMREIKPELEKEENHNKCLLLRAVTE